MPWRWYLIIFDSRGWLIASFDHFWSCSNVYDNKTPAVFQIASGLSLVIVLPSSLWLVRPASLSMRQNGETVQTPGHRSLRWGLCQQCPALSLVISSYPGLSLADTDTAVLSLVATSTALQPGPGPTDQPSTRNLKLTCLRSSPPLRFEWHPSQPSFPSKHPDPLPFQNPLTPHLFR